MRVQLYPSSAAVGALPALAYLGRYDYLARAEQSDSATAIRFCSGLAVLARTSHRGGAGQSTIADAIPRGAETFENAGGHADGSRRGEGAARAVFSQPSKTPVSNPQSLVMQ
jgi:hypothetical protein